MEVVDMRAYVIITLLSFIIALKHASAEGYVPLPARDMTGNLLINGEFLEPRKGRGGGHADGFPVGTTEIPGWKVSGFSVSVFDIGEHFPQGRVLALGSRSVISQPVDLTPGRRYRLSFLVSCSPAGPTVRSGVVRLAGKTFPFSRTVVPSDKLNEQNFWTLVTCEVEGSGKSTLEIASTTDDPEQHGPHLAHMALQAIGAAATVEPVEAAAQGRIVSVDGDVLTIDQEVLVSGQKMTMRTRFYLHPATRVAAGWKALMQQTVHMRFKLGPDGRKMVTEIGP